MANCTLENKTPSAPWCAACWGGIGIDSCPFTPQNATSKTRLDLILKNGSRITDLKHFYCAKKKGCLLDDDESKPFCNIVGFVQFREDGAWEVSIPVEEISAILHGPLQEDE